VHMHRSSMIPTRPVYSTANQLDGEFNERRSIHPPGPDGQTRCATLPLPSGCPTSSDIGWLVGWLVGACARN
jgi:hypothetical protein